MTKSQKEEIDLFLEQCRKVLDSSFILHRTPKNKETITSLGITNNDVKNEIASLTIENYSEGPLPSRSYSEEIWIFGKIIDCHEIYIKIQLSKYNDPGEIIDTLYCISFHFAERPLDYPYQNK